MPRRSPFVERIVMWIYFLIVAGVVILDQITKVIVLNTLAVGESVPLIRGVFHFTHVKNPGAAFGMLENNRWVFIVISLVAVFAMMFYLVKYRPRDGWLYVPLCMIAGGGFGNMIDRLFYGEKFGHGLVVDFLDFCAFPRIWHWIFNVADAFVVVGAGILFVYLLRDTIKEMKESKKPETRGDDHA